MSAYDEALLALYRAPFDAFVVERKRLAAELKASGDTGGAAMLAKRARPPISAWVVNQLFSKDHETFDALFRAAARLRDGDSELAATQAHRDALAKLRVRAARLLGEAGKSASEATLRRVSTTLAALAASGGFDPDPPGALGGDRDPPGFEAASFVASAPAREPTRAKTSDTQAAEASRSKQSEAAAAARQRQADEQAAQREAELERDRARRERERIERRLRLATAELEAKNNELSEARRQLAAVEESAAKARANVEELEAQLVKLGLDET